jgi:hypothetical protein
MVFKYMSLSFNTIKMNQKQLLLFGECHCAGTLSKMIEDYSNIHKIYNKIDLLLVVFDTNNYGVNIDKTNEKIHILYIDQNVLIQKSIVRDIYNKHCNVELFAQIMNHVMEELLKDNYQHIDYLVYYANTHNSILPINKIIQIVHRNMDFDIVFSNDMTNPMFINAYRSDTIKAGIEIYGKKWENEIQKRIHNEIQTSTNEYVSVLSGFGTVSIINKKSIEHINCSCLPQYNLDYYYRTQCNDIIISSKETLNDTLLGMYIFENSSIFYLFNHCLNYPTVHPFVNLCFNIRGKKEANFFICKTFLTT